MALTGLIESHRRRINAVLVRGESLSLDQSEMRADMAKYACVLTSGLVEVSVRTLLRDWCTPRCHPISLRYVDSQLRQFQNPKIGVVLDLIGNFDEAWRTMLETRLSDEQKDAVNSVVANRHRIAHGDNVGLSLVPMRRYFYRCTEVVELVDECIQ